MHRASSKLSLPAWLKATLVGLTVLLVSLVALVLVAVPVLRSSPAPLEYALEALVSRVLAREFQIGELVEAELGLNTYLLATDVSLANPAWAEVPEFATAGRLLLRINLPSIWRDGPILITELVLTEAKLNLLAPGAHRANWKFWPSNAQAGKDNRKSDPGKAPGAMFPVQINSGRVDSSVLVFRDDKRDLTLSIEHLLLQESGPQAPVLLELTGVVNKIPLHVKGSLGPSAALVNWRHISLDLSTSLGNLELQANGKIDDLTKFSGPDLHLKVQAPRSRPLLDLLGIPGVRDGPIHFEGHLTDGHPGVAVEANGMLASFGLQASGKLDNPIAFDGVDLTFKVDGPSMLEAGMFFGVERLPKQPFEVSGEIRRKGEDLNLRNGIFSIGDGKLSIEGQLPQFPDIDDWTVDVTSNSFDLEQFTSLLGVQSLPPAAYAIKGTLGSTDKGKEVVELRVQNAETKLVLKGVVGQSPDYFGTHFDVQLTATSLKSAGSWFGVNDLPNSQYNASAGVSFGAAGWQLSDGIFTSSGVKFGLSGGLDRLPEPTELNAKLSLHGDNFARTLATYGVEAEGVPSLPIAIEGRLSGTLRELKIDQVTASLGESLLKASGELGDPSTLKGLNLNATLTSPNLWELVPQGESDSRPRLAVSNQARVSTSAEGIGIEDLSGSVGGLDITMKGRFNLKPPHKNSHFTLTSAGSDLGEVLNPWLQQNVAAVPFDISLDSRFDAGGLQIDRLEATLADARLNARLELDDMKALATVSGHVKLKGPSSDSLAQALGMKAHLPDAGYVFSADVQNSSGWIALSSIALQWGKGDLTGKARIRPGAVPTVEADLHSKFVNIPFLLPKQKELAQKETAGLTTSNGAAKPKATSKSMVTAKLTRQEQAERVIPDDKLNFSWLNSVRGTLKYQVDEVYVSEDSKSSANIDVSLVDGVFSAKRLSWDGSFISGDAELTIRASGDGAKIESYVDMHRIPLLVLLGGQPDTDPSAFYRAKISTVGSSYREMAQRANGALVFQGGGGVVDTKGIDLILGDTLEEIFDRLNPFSTRDAQTEVVCHAGAMSITNGEAMIDPGIVIRTGKMDIASGGTVDMQTEQLDLAFNTQSRRGIGVSAGKAITPYFKIGGTLANPRLVLDAKGAALSGGAAVATAGLSILAEGLWDRWIATAQNPCEGLITRISKEGKTAYSSLLGPSKKYTEAPTTKKK